MNLTQKSQSITAAFIYNFKRACLHVSVGALRGQKGASDHLELEPTDVGEGDQTCVSLNHEMISTGLLLLNAVSFQRDIISSFKNLFYKHSK